MLAVLGFPALIKDLPNACALLRYAGAGYLIYPGVRTFLSTAAIQMQGSSKTINLSHIYWQNLIVNILNPKVTLFLSQFVNMQAEHTPTQMLLLATAFTLQAPAIFSVIACFSGMVSAFFKAKH